ncbi:carbohydrate ABC transporter permease [Ilumatobacter sp.]|uniref:carbohydrate ABC transporter permease n=1 Tax=Ilumatobacter sp. TaxID=1967498 RepID=UPI003B522737
MSNISTVTTDEGAPGDLPRPQRAIDDGSNGSGGLDKAYGLLRAIPASALWLIVVIWTIPTFGLLVSSFRTRDAQRSTGWWNGLNPFEWTWSNYADIFTARQSIGKSLLNSMAISIPAVVIPIAIAAFAAYGFAWIDFRGRKPLFIATVALLAVPLQVALIPLLQMFNNGASLTLPGLDKTITLIPDFDLAGTTTAVWLTHTGFAMPFAIFLLHNYISALPKDVFEAARIDGAAHFTIFWRLVLPLSIPVLAAFAIFQFLWTWNDYLIANTMIGANADAQPTTILIANLAGDFGRNENILPAAAFVQSFIPILVFFALQRFFVRGLLAGSVKG